MGKQGIVLVALAAIGVWLLMQRKAAGIPVIPELQPPEIEEGRFLGVPDAVAPLPGAPFPAVPWIPMEPPVSLSPNQFLTRTFGVAEMGEAQL